MGLYDARSGSTQDGAPRHAPRPFRPCCRGFADRMRGAASCRRAACNAVEGLAALRAGHGLGGRQAGCRGGAGRDAPGRQRRRCGDRGACGARPGGAAKLRPWRRRIHGRLRPQVEHDDGNRRARDRADDSDGRLFHGQRQEPWLRRCDPVGQVGGRAGRGSALQGRARKVRQAGMGQAVRRGNQARG